MKKKLICLFSLFALMTIGCVSLCIAPSLHMSVAASEVVEPTIEIAEVEHGAVSIQDAKESYAVGDIVTLHFEADHFYMLDSVLVNDVSLVAGEDGSFSFKLVSGVNKISATFKVDEKLLGDFASIYESIQQRDWQKLFSPETLLIFLGFLFNSGIAVALLNIYTKYKKTGSVDRKEVISTIKEVMPEEAKGILKNLVSEEIVPVLVEAGTKLDYVVQMCTKFIQAFLYSLEGTMESKEKIISLLSGLDLSEQNTIDELKTWFSNEMKRIDEKNAEYEKIISELKKSNQKALSEIEINETQQPEKDEEKEEVPYDGTSI